MDPVRFDRLTRALATSTSRRAALLGGLAAGVAGLAAVRARLPGLAEDAAALVASPAALPLTSPVASPGQLDLLAGTPPAISHSTSLTRKVTTEVGCFNCLGSHGALFDRYCSQDFRCEDATVTAAVLNHCQSRCGKGCNPDCFYA